MCNLYTVRKSAAEVAAHFGVEAPELVNTPEETLPGYNGMVIREGRAGASCNQWCGVSPGR